uniref:Endonuclease/exonuclease/phosphatase domain-containing protein n=1 Tax=Ananas comosus var. bracteatus TaxID=296719 RepID=A0A6V7PF13_ANACO|nr:unnamed protein product [Ananas comosus var. bracteatus]
MLKEKIYSIIVHLESWERAADVRDDEPLAPPQDGLDTTRANGVEMWRDRGSTSQVIEEHKSVDETIGEEVVELVEDVTRFYITNVYGSTNWEGKEDLFLELAQLECYKGKWIMCGDFNNTRFQEERKGKTRSSKATVMSNELIKELALIDLPMSNQSFTLSNIQRNSTLARLDRFLISTEWDQEFPLTKVEALPRVTSNHCPILLLTVRNVTRKNRSFVLRMPGFITRTLFPNYSEMSIPSTPNVVKGDVDLNS